MMRFVAIVVFLVLAGCSNRSEIFISKEGVAIHGYDPVAYFKKDRPVKGFSEYSLEWRGATWNFSTIENKEAFLADPEMFAPQYGGFCAFGMSNGYKATTDPEAWSIVGEKLYLNYNFDVRDQWFGEKTDRIRQADLNWLDARSHEM